jgi:micrococcal nuclease
LYSYEAKIVDVYDGDTFTFYVDLGFDVWVKSKLRLYGVNTPEVRGPERSRGLVVRDYVRKEILGKLVTINVFKKGKYGRYVASVLYPKDNVMTDLSEDLIARDYAVAVDYG